MHYYSIIDFDEMVTLRLQSRVNWAYLKIM